MRMWALSTILALGASLCLSPSVLAVDLSRQEPIEIRVDLGKELARSDDPTRHRYIPNELTLETGKLYRLVLHNPSSDKHYFSSPYLAANVWTRKVQVMDESGPDRQPLAEIKGAIREIEVLPGATAEWWFVPVATGAAAVYCNVKEPDGTTHAEHGMKATVVIN